MYPLLFRQSRDIFEKAFSEGFGGKHTRLFFPEKLITVSDYQVIDRIPDGFRNCLEYGEQVPRHVEFRGDFDGCRASGVGLAVTDEHDRVETLRVDTELLEQGCTERRLGGREKWKT